MRCRWFAPLVILGTGLTGHQAASSADAEIERLINQLLDVGQPTAGAHPTAWASQFSAIDEEPSFHGGIIGSAKPIVDPVERKLVQKGVAALPALIAHLNDSRPTHLVVQPLRATWFADEFAPRYLDPARHPIGVNTPNYQDDLGVGAYTVEVGDLCFVAIGQIVNRDYSALRYQPTACQVINSPVHTPRLAAAVKKDWSRLTPAEHKRQLETDAYNPAPYAAPEALKRLLYYYPADGERIALKLLNRSFYESREIWAFADQLVKVKEPQQWRPLYERAVARFGPEAAGMLPHWIHCSNWMTSTEHPKEQQDRAARVLKALFPAYSPYTTEFHNVTDVDDQVDLIRGLSAFRNAKIDAAVHAVFVRALARKPRSGARADDIAQRNYALDELAIACAGRLAGKGHDREYVTYIKDRVQQILFSAKDSPERYRLDDFRGLLKKLKA